MKNNGLKRLYPNGDIRGRIIDSLLRRKEQRIRRKKKKDERRNKELKSGILLASVAAPPLLTFLFLDVFAKRPVIALVYFVSMVVWDILFAIANAGTKKKPRLARRSMETVHTQAAQDFRFYDITESAEMAREEIAS